MAEIVKIFIKGVEYTVPEAKEIYHQLLDIFSGPVGGENLFPDTLFLTEMIETLPDCPKNGIVRVYNACRREQITTIQGLSRLSKQEFKKVHMIGQQAVKVAEEYLSRKGKSFRK